MPTLAFYDVLTATPISTFDVGLVAPSSSDDTQLRVLNTSTLYIAADVTVTVGGDHPVPLYLSLDGDTFTASIGLGDIMPSSHSPVITLRRVTQHMTSPGTYTATLLATPGSWRSTDTTDASDNIPLETEV